MEVQYQQEFIGFVHTVCLKARCLKLLKADCRHLLISLVHISSIQWHVGGLLGDNSHIFGQIKTRSQGLCHGAQRPLGSHRNSTGFAHVQRLHRSISLPLLLQALKTQHPVVSKDQISNFRMAILAPCSTPFCDQI